MAELTETLQVARPDDVYEAILRMHEGLTPEQSALVNARLILLLANQIGDEEVLLQAFRAAREGVGPPDGSTG